MKNFVKIFITALVSLIFFNASAESPTAPKYSDPYTMMNVVADATFKRIAKEQTAITKNPEILRAIVTEELLPYVDSRYAARVVIGSSVNVKDVSPTEVATFTKAFEDYMVGTYAGVFTQYKQQKVDIEQSKPIDPKKKIITIKTRVIESGKPDINIEFKLRRVKNADNWLVYDMVAEGISLLESKRSELGGLIRQQGLLPVASLLAEKAKAPIKAPEKSKNA